MPITELETERESVKNLRSTGIQSHLANGEKHEKC